MWYFRFFGSLYLGYWGYASFAWWTATLVFIGGMIVTFPLQLLWDVSVKTLFPDRAHKAAMAEISRTRQAALNALPGGQIQDNDTNSAPMIIRDMLAKGASDQEIYNALSRDFDYEDVVGLIDNIESEQAVLARPPFLIPDEIAKDFADLLASGGIVSGHQVMLECANVEPQAARDFLLAFKESLDNPAKNYPSKLKPNDGTSRQRSSLATLVELTQEAIKSGQHPDSLALRVSYGAGADINDVRRLFEAVL